MEEGILVKKALTGLTGQLSEEEFLLGQDFENGSDWFAETETEGQLAVDVYQTQDDIVVKAPVAGVEESHIDIVVSSTELTIKGERKEEKEVADENYHTHECYWGTFSRMVTLPVEGDAEGSRATFKNGILTVRIPKSKKGQARKLHVNQ